MPERATFLSVVVPAYNESDRIVPTLAKLSGYLSRQPYTSEVLVVDDGSEDDTTDLVERFGADEPRVRLVRAPHRGKGGAVKRGMLEATGDFRFLCDADLSMPVDELAKFLPGDAPEGVDVAIGSREAAGARRYEEPWLRHLMGRVFNLLVRVVAVRGISDTQCGFKCFNRRAADLVFPRQRMNGFGFDVEVLFIARKHGLRLFEVPIDWYHVPKSKVDPYRDTIRMVSETLRVRLNDLRGRYD
jgi:dolichyl-phosphate beta-glucosyltransferase